MKVLTFHTIRNLRVWEETHMRTRKGNNLLISGKNCSKKKKPFIKFNQN